MRDSSYRFNRSARKGPARVAEDVAWAITITALVFAFAGFIGAAWAVGWGGPSWSR